MPDVACQYTLTSGSGSVVFNSGAADQFYITEIPVGLSGEPVSAPVDPVPFSDGNISYLWWKRGRQIQIEGVFLITSTRVENNILVIRNQMEAALFNILDATINVTPGTLAWTPLGGSPHSISVRNNVPLECVHDQGYLVRTFTFGLFSDSPAGGP